MDAVDIRFVVDEQGKPAAVLVDIATWERILEALEDAEDIHLAHEALVAIDAAGGDLEKAGLISWEQARLALEQMDDTKA